MVNPLLIGIILPFSIIIVAVIYLYYATFGLAKNNPKSFLKKFKKKDGFQKVVCLGDSITLGKLSADYVSELEKKLNDKYHIINAGENGDTSWDLLQRLVDVLKLDPDIVVILVGTNDAYASLNDKQAELYMKRNNLPQKPNIDWFEQNLTDIVRQLKSRAPHRRIILISLPTIGEIVDHPLTENTQRFAEVTEKVSKRRKVEFINFHETLKEHLKTNTQAPKYHISLNERQIAKNAIRHYWFRKSWDNIGKKDGFIYHTDYLHLNNKGASLLINLLLNNLNN